MRRTWDPTVPVIILASAMVAGVLLATGGLRPGAWRATLAANRASIRLEMRLVEQGSESRFATDVPVTELTGFDEASLMKSGAPIRLAWKHDAGAFVLEGEGGRHPYGIVRFEPSTSFRESWLELGLEPLTDRDLFKMAVAGVRLADVQRLKEGGVEDLTVRGVIELAYDADLMRWVTELQAQQAPVRLRDVVRLRNHGVAPETYREYVRSGVPADVEEIIRLSNHGVDPRYVEAVLRAGIGATDLDGMRRLHAHGVSPEYVAGIRSSGLKDTGVEEIVRLHNHGIEVEYVRGVIASGVADLTLDGVVRLHAHGVEPEYARAVAEFGPGDRAVDDAIRLHGSGVSTEFMRSRAARGTERPSTDATLRSWARGGDDSAGTP
jgi:hypothetical protein